MSKGNGDNIISAFPADSAETEELLRAKLNLETSLISWHDLQTYYARGQVISVSRPLDLIDVAYQIAVDNKSQFELWQNANQVALVKDEQALDWHEKKVDLWAVVVRPWVLVQTKKF